MVATYSFLASLGEEGGREAYRRIELDSSILLLLEIDVRWLLIQPQPHGL